MTNLSYRVQRLSIPSKVITPVYFNDTAPNNFIFNNLSSNYLYMGLNTNLDENINTLKISPNASATYSMFNGSNVIYVYNAGATSANIILTSFEGSFTSDFVNTNMSADMVISLNALNQNMQKVAQDITWKQQAKTYVYTGTTSSGNSLIFPANFVGRIKFISCNNASGTEPSGIKVFLRTDGANTSGYIQLAVKQIFNCDYKSEGFSVSKVFTSDGPHEFTIIYEGYYI